MAMIQKIQYLISIGKYRNYQATGDVAFKKLNLIYGDNGGGKTTLTAVFRSLAENNPEFIKRRTSTNSSDHQSAQIIQRTANGDTYYTFNQRTGWSANIPDIEIFDIHFVNENIYSGFDFSDEHKKHLHQFVIGAQGIAIKQQIEQNKLAKTISRQTQSNLGQQLIQDVGNDLTLGMISSFITISPNQNANIDAQIASAETSLANANANAVIQTLQQLSSLNRINSGIDFVELIRDLETNSQTIQNDTLQALFKEHCEHLSENSIDGPERWLQTGFSYIEDIRKKAVPGSQSIIICPFCKQTIEDTLEIIQVYTLRFNEEFNNYIERLQTHLKKIANFNLETNIQALNNIRDINSARIASWTPHLPVDTEVPIFCIITDEESIRSNLQGLIELVKQKISNPSLELDSSLATNFQEALQSINENIDNYNTSIANYNLAIATFRSGILTVDNATKEVQRLKRIKKRFEPPADAICQQLVNERQNLRTLKSAYRQLVQQQEADASIFFCNYKTRINYYLDDVFKTPFQIGDVVHVPPQGRATQSKIGYKLTIDGQDISFDENQPNCAKDCLSEGDKSTIALAFFLSKLDIDTSLKNKVIIFDDPLSSFDSNRRMYTVQLLKDLYPRIKQIIVLSHNEFFLYELSKFFSPNDKKTLRISENFLTKESKLEPLNLESLVENDYFKHVKELEAFLQRPDLSKKEIVLGWLRNVLESHIRFKFYCQLNSLNSSNQTFGNLIKTLDEQNIVFRDDTNRITIISKLHTINAVSWRLHHGEPSPDFGSLRFDPNAICIAELANFVTDTLNLIDNQL